jgi:hypothetical protein
MIFGPSDAERCASSAEKMQKPQRSRISDLVLCCRRSDLLDVVRRQAQHHDVDRMTTMKNLTPSELGLDRVCYSIGDTAELLSTSRDAIYEMSQRGEIAILDLGPRKRRVLACEIADHLNRLRLQAAS